MLLSVPMRHMKMHFMGTRYYLQGSVEFSFMLIIFNCSVRLRWFMNINLVQCICQSPLGSPPIRMGMKVKLPETWNLHYKLNICGAKHVNFSAYLILVCLGSLKLFNIPLAHFCRWERTFAHWGCIAW